MQVTVGTGVGVAVVLTTRAGLGVTPRLGLIAAAAMVLQSTSVTRSTLPHNAREWQKTGWNFWIMVSLLIFSGEGKVDKNCEIGPERFFLYYSRRRVVKNEYFPGIIPGFFHTGIPDTSIEDPGAWIKSGIRSLVPSPVQVVCKDLEDQDKDAEHGDIEERVEMGVTMIRRLDEVVAIGKR